MVSMPGRPRSARSAHELGRRVCALLASALVVLTAAPAQPLHAADSALPEATARKTRLRLSVDQPIPDSNVGNEGGLLFLAGEALAHYGEFRAQDLVFAIDTSESVGMPSGIDANGDGRVSRGEPLDPGMFDPILMREPVRDQSDSILAAEVAAVRGVLERLDARTTRVGVVTFSGKPGSRPPHAATRVELTSNFDDVRDGLLTTLGIGPSGHTNILAGVELAVAELTAAPGALSAPRLGVDRRIMLLTDGISTLPVGGAVRHNRDLVIREGRTAARADIRIDTFNIGTGQYDPITANGLARATGGSSAALANVAGLAERLPAMEFGEITELRVLNLTRAQPAAYLAHGTNGRFTSLVQLAEGANVLQVYARTADGTEATRELSVRFTRGGSVQLLPAEQDAERTRLMAKWLAELKRRGDELQAARDAQVLRALQEQMDAERAKARQRRSLEIEAEQAPPARE